MFWRVIGWSSAVGAAALGASLYVAAPSVATYWLSFLLLLPLWIGVFVRFEDHLPLRVQWIAAVLLAAGGVAGYVLWPNASWWNFGQLAVVPLVVLIVKRGGTAAGSTDGVGGFNDGTWGPP